MRSLCVLLSGAIVACASSRTPASSSWTEDTDVAWVEMQRSLNGTFRATTAENRTITASYRSVSKGTVIVETFTSASGKETISVYHRDGKTLMATHYCAQGNQPRLKAVEARRERVVFSFADATDVGAEESVMEKLVFVFGSDGFDQETVYREPNGERETTKLHFVRTTE
jgi:hypothetical protein